MNVLEPVATPCLQLPAQRRKLEAVFTKDQHLASLPCTSSSKLRSGSVLAHLTLAMAACLVCVAPLALADRSVPLASLESRTFALPLPGDREALAVVRSRGMANGTSAMRGTLAGEPDSLFAVVRRGGIVEGVVQGRDGVLRRIVNDGLGGPAEVVDVVTDAQRGLLCGVDAAEFTALHSSARPSGGSSRAALAANAGWGMDAPVVSVLVGFTAAAAEALGGMERAAVQAVLAITATNAALDASAAQARLSLAGAIRLDGLNEDALNGDEDCEWLGSDESGRAFCYAEQAMRPLNDRVGADLMYAVAAKDDWGERSVAGLGSLGGYEHEARFAMSFLHLGEDWPNEWAFWLDVHTFAHKVGHNLSLWHDRLTVYEHNPLVDDDWTPTTDCPAHDVGYGFRRQPVQGSNLFCDAQGGDWVTIMSYQNTPQSHVCADGTSRYPLALLRFSNPGTSHRTEALGVPGADCEPGWPLGPVNAVRALDVEALRASRYGAGVHAPPDASPDVIVRTGDGESASVTLRLDDLAPLAWASGEDGLVASFEFSADGGEGCLRHEWSGGYEFFYDLNEDGVADDHSEDYRGGCQRGACSLILRNVCERPVEQLITLACEFTGLEGDNGEWRWVRGAAGERVGFLGCGAGGRRQTAYLGEMGR